MCSAVVSAPGEGTVAAGGTLVHSLASGNHPPLTDLAVAAAATMNSPLAKPMIVLSVISCIMWRVQ